MAPDILDPGKIRVPKVWIPAASCASLRVPPSPNHPIKLTSVSRGRTASCGHEEAVISCPGESQPTIRQGINYHVYPAAH